MKLVGEWWVLRCQVENSIIWDKKRKVERNICGPHHDGKRSSSGVSVGIVLSNSSKIEGHSICKVKF